jgi:uncharacterized coiled-coil DUF342 family protein
MSKAQEDLAQKETRLADAKAAVAEAVRAAKSKVDELKDALGKVRDRKTVVVKRIQQAREQMKSYFSF